MSKEAVFATSSKGILNQKALGEFLQKEIEPIDFSAEPSPDDIVIVWGKKDNAKEALIYSEEHGLPFMRLEDAFLGYFGHPGGRHIRVGLIKDRQGIYYDAHGDSDLDTFTQQPLSGEQLDCSKNDLELFKSLRLSKYNDPKIQKSLLILNQDYVLLVDQTFGDQSIRFGGANQDCFLWMLLDALSLYPDSKIIIRTHPDVKAGLKTGCFDEEWLSLSERIELNDEPLNAVDLIQSAQAVFCVTSQLGFEAILHDKKVFTYSTAFYTGYDLSQDRINFVSAMDSQEQAEYFQAISRGSAYLTIGQFAPLVDTYVKKREQRLTKYWQNLSGIHKKLSIFYAAMVRYATYVHPDNGEVCSLTELLYWFSVQQKFSIDTQSKIIMHDFSLWKRWFIPAFMPFQHRENLVFTGNDTDLVKQLDSGSDVIVTWGAVRADRLRGLEQLKSNHRVYCVEDGFIRSQGLGVDLKRPSSLCFDDLSIYYNSLSPSRLNQMLNSAQCSAVNIEQAKLLINEVRVRGLSKYNVGLSLNECVESQLQCAKEAGKEIILVPGQVMGDASLKYGTSDINSNEKLIQQVRKDYPQAFIVYKPHPDVFASKKGDFRELELAHQVCDLVLGQQNIALLYPYIQRLCTMTSLSGFEALLRGISVDCYGQPFYSGWGLTKDYLLGKQQGTTVSLEQLVSIVLIDYPVYVNWQTWTFMQPEVLIAQMSAPHGKISGTGFIGRILTKARYFSELYKMSRSRY